MYNSIDLLLYSKYFPPQKINVNKFPKCYYSMLYLHQLSFLYVFVGRKKSYVYKILQVPSFIVFI